MKTESFTGIKFSNFNAQDLCAVEGPGPIQDRTKEHLASSDATLVVSRKLLLKATREVQEGSEAPFVVKDPKANHFPYILAYTGLIAGITDWKEYFKQLEAYGGVT